MNGDKKDPKSLVEGTGDLSKGMLTVLKNDQNRKEIGTQIENNLIKSEKKNQE